MVGATLVIVFASLIFFWMKEWITTIVILAFLPALFLKKETIIAVGTISLIFFWIARWIVLLILVGIGGGTLDLENGSLGRFKIGMWDSHVLVLFPSYDYFYGHKGGYGNTLMINSEKYSVAMGWAYNSLEYISVGKNWTGQTERGLRIGDSIERAKQLYSDLLIDMSKEKTPIVTPWYSSAFFQQNHYSCIFTKDGKVDSIQIYEFGSCDEWRRPGFVYLIDISPP